MAQENKQAVRRLFEGINARKDEALDRFFASDYVNHNAFPGQTAGAAGAHIALKAFLAGFPDLKFEIVDLVAESDKVVVRLMVSGTHLGDFRAFPATGN